MDTNRPLRPASQAFLGAATAGAWDRRLATAFIALCLLALVAVAPFAHTPLARIPATVAAYESALWLCDLITAVLLLGQFYRSQSPSILVLSAGYLFCSSIIVPHILTYPGLFSAQGLLGSHNQTVGWLYMFWHGGFPLFVLAHSVMARMELRRDWCWRRPGLAILGAAALVACLVVAAAWLALHPEGLLPVISVNGDYSRMVSSGVSPFILILTMATLAVVWRNSRGTVMDIWLMVVLCAWICDIGLSVILSVSRFDLAWYGGRAFALASGTFLLGVLLLDLSRLYSRLADALEDAQAQNLALVRSREELMRVQRLEAIGQLTGGIAHDFNNILTAIIGGLEMIVRRPGEPERVARLARQAAAAADRGAQLIRQLLTFARKQNLKPMVLDPNELLLDLRALVKKALGESIAIKLDLDDTLARVRVDAAELQACVFNLVSNARDAMPGGGVLTLHTRNRFFAFPPQDGAKAGDYVLIAIADTGEGMDAATQARVFEPFFTTKDIGKGTGLGLSQVYGFAQSADGFVAIDSAPGEGTTVSIYLPRCEARPEPAPAPAPPSRAATRSHILVVEDDADVMTATAEALGDAGFEVLAAADGDQAMAILAGGRRVDLLFSDVAMPGSLNGIELARAAVRLRPNLKVLLTSGYAGALLDSQGHARDLPTLAKPYRRDELISRLEALLRASAPSAA